MLTAGKLPPLEFSRPEIAAILASSYRRDGSGRAVVAV
jgi:ATP sulfurylase (sulfate adenylyltransferase)